MATTHAQARTAGPEVLSPDVFVRPSARTTTKSYFSLIYLHIFCVILFEKERSVFWDWFILILVPLVLQIHTLTMMIQWEINRVNGRY